MPPLDRPFGLFHSEGDLALARENREREPIRGSLTMLESPSDDPLVTAQLAALRSQLRGDAEAGHAAIEALREGDFTRDEASDLAAIKRSLGWISVMAMLRDQPGWQRLRATYLDAVKAKLQRLNTRDETGDKLREFWLGAATMAAGILLENDENIERGADVYRRAVDQQIHPEGYLKGIVDTENASRTYASQLSGTCALVLLAEMAAQVGLNLWSYDNRAVTVITAATYTFYYYFFPEKWRWESGLTRERTNAVIRREGAFMEMVNRRQAPHGIEQLFEEQRPLFCAYGGGLTTLTHGLAPPRKKRWRLF